MSRHPQVTVAITQRINVDAGIEDEIAWLNSEGVRTEGSCRGDDNTPPHALIKPSSVEKARLLGYLPRYMEELGLFEIRLHGGLAARAIKFEQVAEQAYDDCVFRAGLVEGHKVDTLYLGIEGEGRPDLTLLLRTDEALALIWVLSGALWSEELGNMDSNGV